MATLNETAYISRVGIKYGLIALAVMIVGRFALGVMVNVYHVLFPAPPAPPTIGFGILPPIEFPQQTSANFNYTLETPDGSLPNLGDKVNVYQINLVRPNLLALEESAIEARHLGFSGEPEQINETTFRWTNNLGAPGTLLMNIYNGRFVLSYDWSAIPGFLLSKRVIDVTQEADTVLDMLNAGKLIGSDIQLGPFKTTFLIAGGENLNETVSLSEADFVQLDFYRAPLEDMYEVVTPDPKKGIIRARLSRHPNIARVAYLEYNYLPVNYDEVETYPMKPVFQAYEELLAGQAYIASVDPLITDVVVRRVELGYYDSYTQQQFLQPVYVFRGDNNFVAYVEAVKDPTLSPTVTPSR